MTDFYAVFGNPIAHSLSPIIHTEFAKQTSQNLSYTKVEVPTDQFVQYVKDFQLHNGKGLNITLPFKQQAFQLASECSQEAAIAQAVNTISFEKDGKIVGYNTDGIGLRKDLVNNHNFSIADKRILIIGAGGAVRGILYPLLSQTPRQIVITNRTFDTAKQLVERMQQYGRIKAVPIEEITGQFDLIINGTSSSIEKQTLPINTDVFCSDSFCYDLMYGQEPTPFLKWATNAGVKQVADGLGMLIEQAAEAFYIWRGLRPDTSEVIKILKKF